MSSKAKCHPDRDMRARGLCASCYVTAQRRGFDTPAPSRYGDYLEEELDFMDLTWEELERAFGRPRAVLQQRLHERGRDDLRSQAHLRSYGETNQAGIQGVLRKERPFNETSREAGRR